MKRLAALLLILALPAAQAGLAADDITGQGAANLQAPDAQVRLSHFDPVILHLDGSLQGQLVDDQRDRIEVNAPPVPPKSSSMHNQTREDLGAWQSAELRVEDLAGGLVLVQGDASGQLQAPWSLEAIEHAVLEESHVFKSYDGDAYYSYESDGAINATATESTWALDGDFEIYVWGSSLRLRDADHEVAVRTGEWHDMDPADPILNHWHDAYALLSGHGHLEWSTTGTTSMYAAAATLQAEGYRLDDGAGHLDDGARSYELDGQVLGAGGSYRIQPADGRLQLDILEAPELRGAGVASTYHVMRASWFWPATAAAGLVLAVAALRIGVLGVSDEWIHRVERRQKAGRRSLLLLRVAQLAGIPRADAALLLGNAHLMRRPAAARASYRRAYELEEKDVDRAAAAFGAARAAALLREAEDAAWWLETAIRLNPRNYGDAANDLAFRRIASDPAFGRIRPV